jgi:hypothetical protein
MNHSNYVDRESRRNALKGMALLSGAAVMTTANTSSAGVATDHEIKSEPPPSLGYRETDHIREYYRRARF